MTIPVEVYVFGDQTYDACDSLSALLQARDDFVLSAFLDASCQVLKQEILKLEGEQRDECPRFSKIAELLALWRKGDLNPCLGQALSCICHIGTFLHEHASAGKAFPTASNACLTARCTGLLSAVAVSCSSSPSELLSLGVLTVAIAFRVGASAWDVGGRLSSVETKDPRYPSWTVALSGPDEEEVLACIEDYTSAKALSKVLAPYVSAKITKSRCSISGRPDVLHGLLAETRLSHSTTVFTLPITAPYHAPHLYTEDDVDLILSNVEHCTSAVVIPVVSSSTGTLMPSKAFPDAIRTAVKACLQHTIRWDLVASGLASYIQSKGEASQFIVRHIASAPDALGSAIEDILSHSSKATHLTLEQCIERGDQSFPAVQVSPKGSSKIAILSMAGRFPQAPSMESFWDVLKNGIDTHAMVPPSRWDYRTHVGDAATSQLGKNVSGTGFGCWLQDAAQFDARFFNMSPREAPQVDPAQRLALLTAAEALEQAGIVPGRTATTQKDRVGVYFGSTSNDWMETNSAQKIDTYFIPGGNRAFIPGRINYHFKFSGPSYTIDTACSSSLAAIHLACNALWKGEVDTAIVGGTNVLTNPDMTAGLDRGHFLSRTGNCKTFDDMADGYCRGEAVATAVLKRLDDALSDKDPIQACILAINTNHSAEADSITRPHVGAQQALFEDVLADAGVKRDDLTYCEMHGTGTQAGDAGETTSVLQSLAPSSTLDASRSRQVPLYIGAAKSNVGHGEAAAGVTSLAKVLLMLKHSTIPPHCGIKTKINHKLPDLRSRNVTIATQPLPWPRPAQGKRRVLLNNFSAAGGNTALVLEDAPEDSMSEIADPRQDHLIAVSAKTAASLTTNIANLVTWLDTQVDESNTTLARLSYTTTARRMHHPHRVMINVSNLDAAKKALRTSLELNEGVSRPKGAPRFVFAFTGQGAQFAGMGAGLYASRSSFRADIHRYNKICVQLELPEIEHLFRDPGTFADATPTMLQVSSVCFQMALYRMWLSFGVAPSAVVGHSLGEYAALYAASVLSQADVISLVGRRAQLLESHCEQDSHAMLAVRSNPDGLEALIGPPGADYEVSCLNGRETTVLGGTQKQMATIRPTLTRHGLSNTFLKVPYAYHTSQVDPVLESLKTIACGIRFAKPAIPVISPTCGMVLTEQLDFGADFVVRHCRGKVDMLSALKAAKHMHLIDEKMMGIEIGPAPIVVKMVKETLSPAFQTFASCRDGDDVHKLVATALKSFYTAGADIDWMAYHADFESCQKVLELPAYGWDLKEYWIQYVNNWSLRKGDPPLRMEPTKLESSTIHHVREDSLSINGGELVVESDLSRVDLHPMVQGHKVYGVPLCTPSVYADIALTIGEHVKGVLKSHTEDVAFEVGDMTIQSALVANSDGNPQILRIIARMDQETKNVTCSFSSVDNNGKITEQHANCVLRMFDVEKARNALQSSLPNTKTRISSLKAQLSRSGNTFRYSKSMIYKMVGQLADFDPKYRALDEITLDSDAYEAVGRVDFTKVHVEGTFHTNPAYIDALSQLGGFVMNGNDSVDLEKELFVNHGWGSLRLFDKVEASKIYTTYVKMGEGKDRLWTGDIVIMSEDKVVGVFSQVALQGVPKRLMQYIVKSANKPAAGPLVSKSDPTTTPEHRSAPAIKSVTTTTTRESMADERASSTRASTIAVDIISQESGVIIEDLTDETRFDDIGVDSLLSLMVSSRIRDELGIDVESSIFLDFSTIGQFKTFIKGLAAPADKVKTVVETVREEVTSVNIAAPSTTNTKVFDVWTDALNIIAEESGISSGDLTSDTRFADIGIDSLLSLIVGSRMREELQLDLLNQSLFLDFPTVESLRARITGGLTPLDIDVEQSDSDVTTDSGCLTPNSPRKTQFTDVGGVAIDLPKTSDLGANPPLKAAWSMILQGSPRNASKRLFLFPDGCGAATSYLKLPTLSPSVAVIGFNSPFMKNPHEMAEHSLPEVVASYIEGVRRHQPHGPYHLGGWSAGGILAYAVAQDLIAAGEEIATLTLIDSPPPNNGLDRLPRRFFDHCSKVGIFGTEMGAIGNQNVAPSKLPDWLMPHFEATIELLHDYHAPSMLGRPRCPREVHIIWAGDCAFNNQYAPLPSPSPETDAGDTEGMKFLTEQRTDFGPGKWADLFPGSNINLGVVRGHHHFSMMRGEGGEQLGQILRNVLCLPEV